AELSDKPEPVVPYCPVENRFKLNRSPRSHPEEGSSCERVSVEVKNSSGVRLEILWVDFEGREVPRMVLDPQDAGLIEACRGHFWRARRSSTSSQGRWRLISEIAVPARHLAPTTSSAPAVHDDGSGSSSDAYRWEVLACIGFRLPEAFGVKSSLGDLGTLEFSRGSLGRRKTGLQEAVLKESTNIEGLVSVTLEEAFKGKNVTVTVKRRIPCPVCHGLGAASFITCDRCSGSGRHTHVTALSNYSVPAAAFPHECHRPDTGTTATGAGVNHGGKNCPGEVGCEKDLSFYGCLCGEPNGKGGKDKGRLMEGPELTRTRDCAKCGGSGAVPAPTVDGNASYCARCAGSRFVEEKAELTLSIPAGVEKGHTEVYRGQGHVEIADLLKKLKPTGTREETAIPDSAREEDSKTPHSTQPPLHSTSRDFFSSPSASPSSSTSVHASVPSDLFEPERRVKRGDFRLTVDVLPHPVYSPEEGGSDLYASISISLAEALAGFTRDIVGLDGSTRTIRRRSRTFPGMLLRFPGLGMPLPSLSTMEPTRRPTREGSDEGPTRESTSETSQAGQKVLNPLPGEAPEVVLDEAVGRSVAGSGAATTMEPAFGDLVVKASIILPSGMRDDRSKFIGTFLKAGPPSAAREENVGAEEHSPRTS
ncbi:unnamed protein product, partial [Scytosiphon promiscuus]